MTPLEGPDSVRPLLDIAIENAQEGCVRETFGALLAWIQSASATEPHLQRALRGIARDETEHAKLAFAVAEFCASRLSEIERQTVQQAQQAAVADLGCHLQQRPDAELQAQIGLPSFEVAQRLFAETKRELWDAWA